MIRIRRKNQNGPIQVIRTIEELEHYIMNDIDINNMITLSSEETFENILSLFYENSNIGIIGKVEFQRKVMNIFGKRNGKKLTINSIKYWELRGLENNILIRNIISNNQRKRSMRTIQYWIERGYSKKDAAKAVSKYQRKAGKQSSKHYKKEVGFKTYKNAVYRFSNKNKPEFKGTIGVNGVSGAYQLDHKFSIKRGFELNIPTYIIAHKENLEYLPWEENIAKGKKCSIDLEDLIKRVTNGK